MIFHSLQFRLSALVFAFGLLLIGMSILRQDDRDVKSLVQQVRLDAYQEGTRLGRVAELADSSNRMSAAEQLVEVLTEAVRQEKVGDPFADETSVGPLIAARQRARVEGFIAAGLAEGARLTTGGGRPDCSRRCVTHCKSDRCRACRAAAPRGRCSSPRQGRRAPVRQSDRGDPG